MSKSVNQLHSGPGQSAASGIADAVARVAVARFGGLHAGEVLTDQGRRVVVYLTRLDPGAEAAMTSGVVSFARAPHSVAFLDALHQRVTARQAGLKRAGIDLVTWGPDVVTGRENISVLNLTAAKRVTLDRLFGTASLTLTNTTRSYTAVPVSATVSHPKPKS